MVEREAGAIRLDVPTQTQRTYRQTGKRSRTRTGQRRGRTQRQRATYIRVSRPYLGQSGGSRSQTDLADKVVAEVKCGIRRNPGEGGFAIL